MPTYEYACRDCGEHLEVVQSFRDEPLTVCPACEGRLRKVFSAAGIVLKGSGWHSKDYAPTRAATKDGDTEPKAASEDKAASERKPGSSGPEPGVERKPGSSGPKPGVERKPGAEDKAKKTA